MTAELEIQHSDSAWRAWHAFKKRNADFADYLIAITNKDQDCEVTVTFENRAARDGYFQLLRYFCLTAIILAGLFLLVNSFINSTKFRSDKDPLYSTRPFLFLTLVAGSAMLFAQLQKTTPAL
jgi:hypothetical protein